MHPALFYHAGLTWNPSQTSYTPLPSILDRHLFQDASGQLSRTLISLGNTDLSWNGPLSIVAQPFTSSLAKKDKLAATLGNTEPRLLARAASDS